MYKNIIPHLISFDTQHNSVNGFYFSDDFSFYDQVNQKERFHFTLKTDDHIEIPKKYDFRNGYYLKSGVSWFYHRQIVSHLNFCYNAQNNIYSFNKLYSLVPFEIGQIFPAGRHVADFINLFLFLNGFIVFRGSAFQYQEKSICIIGPGFIGKTTLVEKFLNKGALYIAEDFVIINVHENKIYPSNLRTNLFSRKANHNIAKTDFKKLCEPTYIDDLYLVQNSTKTGYTAKEKNMNDFLGLCSLDFLKNPFIRSYIFEENLFDLITNKINEIKHVRLNYHYQNIYNYNYHF